MQNSFPYIDILIFGIIAIFLIFRLKNILGTKTGFEETNLNKKNEDKQFTNVVPLKSNKNDIVDLELKTVTVHLKEKISEDEIKRRVNDAGYNAKSITWIK